MASLNLQSVSSRDALEKENEKNNWKIPEIFDIKALRLKLVTTGRNVRSHKRRLEVRLDPGLVNFTAEPESEITSQNQLRQKVSWNKWVKLCTFHVRLDALVTVWHEIVAGSNFCELFVFFTIRKNKVPGKNILSRKLYRAGKNHYSYKPRMHTVIYRFRPA